MQHAQGGTGKIEKMKEQQRLIAAIDPFLFSRKLRPLSDLLLGKRGFGFLKLLLKLRPERRRRRRISKQQVGVNSKLLDMIFVLKFDVVQ